MKYILGLLVVLYVVGAALIFRLYQLVERLDNDHQDNNNLPF